MPSLKTVIVFGPYSIPVSMRKATVDTDIQLHEYHGEDQSRTGRRTVCTGCGKELAAGEIVKGYEYDKHCLVLLAKEELRQLKSGAENTIEVLYATPIDQIPPYYYSHCYFASPEPGGEKMLETVRLALLDERKALIGRAVMGGLDSYVAVGAAEDGLIISKLYLDNELNHADQNYKKPLVAQRETADVKELLNAIGSDFDLSAYENEYQSNLRRLISSKIAQKNDTYGC